MRMVSSLHQTVQCQCGKIQLAIDSPSVLRLVCYSQDYRGYYNALNEKAEAKNQPTNAKLDAWGGVDLTQIYVSSYSSYYVTEHVIFRPNTQIHFVLLSQIFNLEGELGDPFEDVSSILIAVDYILSSYYRKIVASFSIAIHEQM